MRALVLALAVGLFAGQAEAQAQLPSIQVDPKIENGIHEGCVIRFILRMGVEQGFANQELATGAINVSFDDEDNLDLFVTLGFVNVAAGTKQAPESLYLVRGSQTNSSDLLTSGLSDGGFPRYSMFDTRPTTMRLLGSISPTEPRVTIGFKASRQGPARQIQIGLTPEQAMTWAECRQGLVTQFG